MTEKVNYRVLPPGSHIGILGGGQLGRMLGQAAAKLGFHVHIFSPEDDAPAAQIANHWTKAGYEDEVQLAAFAESVDVITYEFENVPAATAAFLSARKNVKPGPRALAISQDRFEEKTFLKTHNVATAPFAPVSHEDEIEGALKITGLPAVLKTRRLGYDGKGQALVKTVAQARDAFASMGCVDAIFEGYVSFTSELSVIGARDAHGNIALYDPSTNEHRDHILFRSHVPAQVNEKIAMEASRISAHLLSELDYVGVMGIEFFVDDKENPAQLLVNEFAPRVHNSGHWTLDACTVSQFEQHIRAICGWPLGPTTRHANAMMQNLIGEEIHQCLSLASEANLGLHVYGKKEARKGRKMGHFTRLYPLTR